jgi:hypothetical protein
MIGWTYSSRQSGDCQQGETMIALAADWLWAFIVMSISGAVFLSIAIGGFVFGVLWLVIKSYRN